VHACYEGVLGSGGNAAIFCNLGTRCRRQVFHTLTALSGEIENLGIRKFHYDKGVWRMPTITALTDIYFSYVCSVYKVIFRSFTYSIVCLQYFQVNIVCTCCDIE
jgi:hypothetical protein